MTTHDDTRHLTHDEQVLHHYGEDEPADRRAVSAHLARCEPCRDQMDRLRHVLEMVTIDTDARAPEGFERAMWARIQAQLPSSSGNRRWTAWFNLRGVAFAGAAAALVLAAFVAGRWTRQPVPAPTPAAVATVAPERVWLVAVGDHLDRSQMVLVELLNGENAEPAALAAERARAADLVAASRLIRQSAAGAGETAMADVLDDLERVLIEIANGSGDPSSEELQGLKARIASNGVLFRLRVVGAEVRERERPPGFRRPPES